MSYRGIEGTSVGLYFELESPEPDMRCPELPDHGTNNFWSASCKIKQQMPEHWKTCYPHCKGGSKNHIYCSENPQNRSKGQRARTDYAVQLAEKICRLYKKGKTINEIADQICRSTKLVSLRLSEAGLTSYGKGPTKKELVFQDWKKAPILTDLYMMNKYCLKRNTVESYRREFKRQHQIVTSVRGQVFAWLKENPDACVERIAKTFDIKIGTASSYHSQFNRR